MPVTPPALVSTVDFSGTGIQIEPIDASHQAGPISQSRAVTVAADDSGIGGDPREVDHVIVRVTPDAGIVTAWLVVFNGGVDHGPRGPAPVGGSPGPVPPPSRFIAYTAVIVDDHTGAVLTSFQNGQQ